MIRDQEESEKYLKIAQKYLLNDDQRNALKYLYKSQQAFPSSYVKGMIDKVEQLISISEENGRFESRREREKWKSGEKYSHQSETNFQEIRNNQKECSDDDDSTREFSQAQLEAVEKITRCKDYYKMLGITKETSDQELKKQYRKLALQFHPDKNKAPGASDAFKAISNAFDVLGDPEKRRCYDLQCSSEFRRPSKTDLYEPYGYSRRFAGQQMGPEELFNVFFGNSHVYSANNRWSNRQASQSSSGISVFLQLLPVIVFIIMSIMSSFLIRDPIFSLARSNKYPLLRKTSDLKIPYFVKENFERDYKQIITNIEQEVNHDFTKNLRTRCFKERNHKENLIWKAKNIGDSIFEDQVRKMKTPSCTELQVLQDRIDSNS